MSFSGMSSSNIYLFNPLFIQQILTEQLLWAKYSSRGKNNTAKKAVTDLCLVELTLQWKRKKRHEIYIIWINGAWAVSATPHPWFFLPSPLLPINSLTLMDGLWWFKKKNQTLALPFLICFQFAQLQKHWKSQALLSGKMLKYGH